MRGVDHSYPSQNNPTEGNNIFVDEIYGGEITVDNIELDDMISIKSDVDIQHTTRKRS